MDGRQQEGGEGGVKRLYTCVIEQARGEKGNKQRTADCKSSR